MNDSATALFEKKKFDMVMGWANNIITSKLEQFLSLSLPLSFNSNHGKRISGPDTSSWGHHHICTDEWVGF
jgi:hypothetical protein